jgi:DNA ligase-1
VAKYYCTLAKKYDPDKHADSISQGRWVVSEKLDGVRALWCPRRKGFFSRSDKPLHVPAEWLGHFAEKVKIPLDGEFFMGRGRFQDAVSKARLKSPTLQDFEGMSYQVFDSLWVKDTPHSERLKDARAAIASLPAGMAVIVQHYEVSNLDTIADLYSTVRRAGGEGVMIRRDDAPYEHKRTSNLLKWKGEIDGIAEVIDIQPGEGKHEGRMGALIVWEIDDENDQPPTFKIGTGFNDNERERKDWLGTRVRWTAHERTRDGIPRHPVYHSDFID